MIASRAEAGKVSGIGEYTAGYLAEMHSRWRSVFGMLSAFLQGKPLSLGNFWNPRLAAGIKRWLAQEDIEAVIVFSSSMAPYVQDADLPLKIMNFCDVDSQKWEDLAQKSSGLKRWIYRREGKLLAKYEAQLSERFDASCFVTGKEAELFRRRCPPSRPVVLPNGVDSEFFGAVKPDPQPWHFAFVGIMDYAPNIAAALFFAEEILPKLARAHGEAHFTIVGGRPSARISALARQGNITVTGYVDDVRPYLAKASAVVVPLAIARGIQNKILEAMAAGIPVITSPAAAAGLPPQAVEGLTVRPLHAEAWLETLEDLHAHAAAYREKAKGGQAFIAAQMSWQASVAVLEGLLQAKPETVQPL